VEFDLFARKRADRKRVREKEREREGGREVTGLHPLRGGRA